VTSFNVGFALGLSDEERERRIKEKEKLIAEMEQDFEAHPDVVLAMFLTNQRNMLHLLKLGDDVLIPDAVYEPPTAGGDSR